MKKRIFKAICIIIGIIFIGIIIMYLIDYTRMKDGKEVIFCTWGKKYISSQNIDENQKNDIIKYSKNIDNIKLELDIPSDWKYEELAKNEIMIFIDML